MSGENSARNSSDEMDTINIEFINKEKSSNLLNGFECTHSKLKIPNKKMNFKEYNYKRRLGYGRMCQMGFVNTNLRYFPELNYDRKFKTEDNRATLDKLPSTSCSAIYKSVNFSPVQPA